MLSSGCIALLTCYTSLTTTHRLRLCLRPKAVTTRCTTGLSSRHWSVARVLQQIKHQSQLHVQVTLGQFEKAAALFKEALQAHPDDWASLQQYLDCMMPSTACPRSAVGKHLAQAKLVQLNDLEKPEGLDQLAVQRVGCQSLRLPVVVRSKASLQQCSPAHHTLLVMKSQYLHSWHCPDNVLLVSSWKETICIAHFLRFLQHI